MSARRVLALTSMLTIAGVGCGGGSAGDTTTPLPSVPTTEGPPPVISSIAPARVCAASAFTLVVRGTGFDGRSVVRLNGAARTTTVVSETELRTGIAATDLTGSSATITVATGTQVGTSSATLAIGGSSSMKLTGAPTGGTAVGQPSFTLPIDGTGFTTSSVATWNGARRPTTYVSASRIVATVDAVDLSAPGQFTIGVADTTDNCPGAGALPFGVLAVGAPTSSNLKAIQTWSTALLWHAGLGRLLVASRSGDLTRGYLFAVDPVTGRATDSIFVDPEPGRMTMTDDGKYLFIQTRALDSPQIVKRVQISPFAVVSQFSVPSNVVGLAALPGSSTSVAVADVSHITIYDDGVARPVAQGGGLFIAFGDAGRLYGLANGITPSTLTTNLVASDGVRAQQGGIDDYFASSNTSMLYRAGRLYLTSGYVLTGDRMDQVVGYIGRTATDWGVKTEDALAVDDRRGRAYEIHNGTLTAWDLNTFQALGSVKAAPAPPYPAALVFLPQAVRWGTDGLAYNDIGWLYMFRSPLVAP